MREREAPKGFVRIEDVQRIVRETLAIERALQAARQEQAQVVETVQGVEADINLGKAARPPKDAKGKGKLRVETPSRKRRKASGGVSESAQVTLSGEELPQRVWKDVKCFNCGEKGHFRDKCPYPRQRRRRQQRYSSALSAPPVQSIQYQSFQSGVRDQQRVQGRSFALASEDAAASTAAVTGILFAVVDACDYFSCIPVVCYALLLICELVFSIPVGLELCSHLCLNGWEGVFW